MKKRVYVVLFSLLLLFSSLFLVSGQSENIDPAEVIGREFNISPERIPTDPDFLEREFLQQEWTEVILRNRFMGPVHVFFTKISPVFFVIVAHKYEFSLTFFSIVLIWIVITIQATRVLNASGLTKGWASFGIGVASAIIVAQMRVIKIIVSATLNLIFSTENVFGRVIFGIIALGVLGLFYVFTGLISQKMKANKVLEKEQRTDQQLQKLERISDKIKKFN